MFIDMLSMSAMLYCMPHVNEGSIKSKGRRGWCGGSGSIVVKPG